MVVSSTRAPNRPDDGVSAELSQLSEYLTALPTDWRHFEAVYCRTKMELGGKEVIFQIYTTTERVADIDSFRRSNTYQHSARVFLHGYSIVVELVDP